MVVGVENERDEVVDELAAWTHGVCNVVRVDDRVLYAWKACDVTSVPVCRYTAALSHSGALVPPAVYVARQTVVRHPHRTAPSQTMA